ncbi:hypothetical protein [Pseudobutyrivibrio ruminis]|uniref:Uncharacterized protein n=1 Tax=Pseudobutyrivibrio ruminis DSM 9787 TaxID=1123011 RepID=A0A285RK41_9FIRM|nr:hypothetical protein [Pseudobutyrivibrio ruminis]SOB92782.1 hypothetical protein SAMN02910411_0962 [Pseudobutyrivibrio ruminis DSM 9787]
MNIGAWMCGVLVLPFAIVGTILSYAITTYMAIPIFIIWCILFFKDTHIDVHKAFDKYLLK